MWRYLLLLLVCAPLLWKVYAEGEFLIASYLGSAAGSEEKLSGYEDKLKAVAENATKKLRAHEELVRCIVRPGEVCPVLASPSQAEKVLRPKQNDYAENLEDVRNFYVDFRIAVPQAGWKNPCRDPELSKWLNDREVCRKEEKEVVDLMERLRDATGADRTATGKKLNDRIDGLGDKPGRNRELLTKARALGKRAEIEDKLDDVAPRILKVLESPSPGGVVKVKADADQLVTLLKQFIDKHEQIEIDGKWASDALKRFALSQRLLDVVARDELNSTDGQFTRHLADYTKLVKDPSLSQDLRALVRTSAQRFCDGFLGEEKLDDKVILKSDLKGKVTVKKSEVKIVRVGESDSTPLLESKDNEFTLKDIKFFIHDKDNYRSIEPTDRSQTAHDYNTLRRRLQWTEKALTNLRDAYMKGKAQERATLNRIEKVLEGVKENEDLFRRN